jgi:GNAT superfamily N-acetyltransferase
MSISDFQIGDRVLYTYKGLTGGMIELDGLKGTVVSLGGIVGVQFDKKFGVGHSCNGRGMDGHCRYLYSPELSIIDSKPVRIRWYKKGKLEEKIIKKFESLNKYKDFILFESDVSFSVDKNRSEWRLSMYNDQKEKVGFITFIKNLKSGFSILDFTVKKYKVAYSKGIVLDYIHVYPRFEGKGYSKMLFEKFFEYCKSINKNWISLGVEADFRSKLSTEDTLKYYERLGFEDIGIRNGNYASYYMIKKL